MSSGIGEALAPELVARGASVAVSARRSDPLVAIAARTPHGQVIAVPVDVTDRAAVATAAAELESVWGGIDLAIFNAGTHQPVSDTALDARDFERLMQVNYLSVIYGIEAVVPGMLARGRWRGSWQGSSGVPGRSTFPRRSRG